MASKHEKLADARPRSTKLIEDMLAQRQQMLVLFWELSKSRQDARAASASNTLDRFLEVLVDYMAAGHFGLYQRIVEGTERRKPVVETAREIYSRIAATTDLAVTFSEKYESAAKAGSIASFANDLSALGEGITSRIELEDRLIMAMLGEEFAIPAVN